MSNIAITEEQTVDAVHRLAMSKAVCPELVKAEDEARVRLAAAIIALDDIEERISFGELMHSLYEQTMVEQAKNEYAQALANLLRREDVPAAG